MGNLKDLYIFEGFDDAFLEKIKQNCSTETYKAGTEIIKQGSISKNAFILVKGIVSVIIDKKVVNTIFQGDIFGEIGLVMDEQRSATIQAETDVEVLVISREILSEIINRNPDGDYIKTTILNRIIQNNKSFK